MSHLTDYLLGQLQQKLHSLESGLEAGQAKTHSKLEALTAKVDEALSWAQRLVLLGLALLGAIGLNLDPDRIGQIVAHLLKAGR